MYIQLLANRTDFFVVHSPLNLTFSFTLDYDKGSLLRASGLIDLQSIHHPSRVRKPILAKERVVATAHYRTLAS